MMRRTTPLLTLSLLVACTGATTAPDPVSRVEVDAGDAQVGSPAYVLAESIAVRVIDAGGHPVAGAVIHWAPEDREAVVMPEISTTGADGVARAAWRLGRDDGVQHAKATLGGLQAARFEAEAVSGEVFEVAGTLAHQCGRFSDDVVRCWLPPAGGPARAIALDTDIRFASLGFASGTWCGGTRNGAIACFDDADLTPGGVFRPDAASIRVVATGVPVLSRVTGAGDPELGTTWCATSPELRVWCWGRNDHGQVGDGTIGGQRDTPVAVAGGLRGLSLGVTEAASCAVDLAGKAWCWGSIVDGVVDGDSDSAVPVVVPGGHLFAALAANGTGSLCAIDGAYTIWCWGSGRDGGRGRAGVGSGSVPAKITGTDLYISVGATVGGFLAVTVDRDLVVWGGLSGTSFTEQPANVLPGYVFNDVLPGGGEGAICLHAYPGGTRCVDRVALARALGAGTTAPVVLIHGVPGG